MKKINFKKSLVIKLFQDSYRKIHINSSRSNCNLINLSVDIDDIKSISIYIDELMTTNFSSFNNQEIKTHLKKLELVFIEISKIVLDEDKNYKHTIKELFLDCFDIKNNSNLFEVEKLFNSYGKDNKEIESFKIANELKILDGQSNKQILEELLELYDNTSKKHSVSIKIIIETEDKLSKILEIYSKID